VADNVDFFSEERWEHSHQYQEILRLQQQKHERKINYLDSCRMSRRFVQEWQLAELSLWRNYWEQRLTDELEKLIPSRVYHVEYDRKRYEFTQEEGKRQANVLAQKAVAAIENILADNLKQYRQLPDGGNIGNIKGGWLKIDGQIQCGEWADKLEGEFLNIIKADSLFSFSIHYMRYVRRDADGMWVWQNVQQHHWIRIVGPSQTYVDIDPWPSGGRYIIPLEAHEPTGTMTINREPTIYGEWSSGAISPKKSKRNKRP